MRLLSPDDVAASLQSLHDREEQMLRLLDPPIDLAQQMDAAHSLASAAGMLGFAALSSSLPRLRTRGGTKCAGGRWPVATTPGGTWRGIGRARYAAGREPGAIGMTLAGVTNGVIVAENDAIFSRIIRATLEHAGQQVFLAADGNEAVSLARQFSARLVLLDIGMPNLNGLMACEEIRLLPGYSEVPIVMLTGYSDDRMRQAAMQLGANDFITKPFQPDALVARLAVYLGPPGMTPPAIQPPPDGVS